MYLRDTWIPSFGVGLQLPRGLQGLPSVVALVSMGDGMFVGVCEMALQVWSNVSSFNTKTLGSKKLQADQGESENKAISSG